MLTKKQKDLIEACERIDDSHDYSFETAYRNEHRFVVQINKDNIFLNFYTDGRIVINTGYSDSVVTNIDTFFKLYVEISLYIKAHSEEDE